MEDRAPTRNSTSGGLGDAHAGAAGGEDVVKRAADLERSVARVVNVPPEREQSEQRLDDTAHLLEESVHLREEVVSLREDSERARHDAAQAKTDYEARVIAQLREANENLVVATVRAQTMTETAERASQQKEQFLAMLAHELRNPLAPIVNALAVLNRVQSPDPLVPWAHDIIKRQVGHMTRLLDDLLDVSRVTRGKIALQKRPTRVSEVMVLAVETSGPTIDHRKQHLTVDVPPEPLTIDGDPARLSQVFSNLLNNAAKYTPEGGNIRFAAQQEGNTVLVSVVDNGFGIAPDALPGIFDLFTQEDRSLARANGGLGIGLTVVRAIIEMHGGTVSARSRGAGAGSEFTVTLPLMQHESYETVVDTEVEAAPPEVRQRIVLIEDNVDANATLRTLLQLLGYDVASAFNGITGVALVQTQRPQIVLCDIGLPGMDGYQVIARLREEMKGPLPVMIALTGYGQPEDRTRALAAGFDRHLVKPVNVDDLLRLIAAEGERFSESRND